MRSLVTGDLNMTSLCLVQQPSTIDTYSVHHALMSDVITLLRTALGGPDTPDTDSDIVKTLVKICSQSNLNHLCDFYNEVSKSYFKMG